MMVRLDLWKCLLKKDSFELGFEVREGGEIKVNGRVESKEEIPGSRRSVYGYILTYYSL